MGITGASEFERWLASTVSRRAYCHALPDDFAGALVVTCLSSVTTTCFMSARNATAEDLVASALRPFEVFVQSECTTASSVPVAQRKPDPCDPVERPTAEQIRDSARQEPAPPMRPDAVFVYALDDARYLPSLRRMEQEKRYSNAAVVDDAQLDARQWRVFGTAPLPGDYPPSANGDQGGPTPAQRKERNEAMSSPAVRSALRYYVPWRMQTRIMQAITCASCVPTLDGRAATQIGRFCAQAEAGRLLEAASRCADDEERRHEYMTRAHASFFSDTPIGGGGGDSGVCKCAPRPNSNRPGRRVVIDAVPRAFDVDAYASAGAVHRVPRSVYERAGRSLATMTLDVERRKVAWSTPVALGEADLKMVHYILQCSREGDDVLVRNSDSDVLYILLLNAHRFMDAKSGQFTRRIFLDQHNPRMADERLPRRFVCINALYRDLDQYARARWSLPKGDSVPHHVQACVLLSAFVFLAKTDYTTGIPGLGPKKRLAVLENEGVMRRISNLFGHLEFLPCARGPVLATVLSLDVLRKLTLECVIQALPARTRAHIEALGPAHRHAHRSVRDAIAATKAKFALPDMDDIVALWSRISWNFCYMGNPHLAIGCFPSPTAVFHDTGRSIWGWNMARKRDTRGIGHARWVAPEHDRAKDAPDDDGGGNEEDCFVPALDHAAICGDRIMGVEHMRAEFESKLQASPGAYVCEIVPPWAASELHGLAQ